MKRSNPIRSLDVSHFSQQYSFVLKKVLWDSLSRDLLEFCDKRNSKYQETWNAGIGYELKFLRDFLGGNVI
jgi:hypothetical protein